MEDVTTIICNIDGKDVWTTNVKTEEQEQYYAGFVFAHLLCHEELPLEQKPQMVLYLSHNSGHDTHNSFLCRAGVHITHAGDVDAGIRWDKVTTVLDRVATYGWVVRPDIGPSTDYALVMFSSEGFVGGFLAGCTAWGVDFRTLVTGPPFRHLDNGDIEYFTRGETAGVPLPEFMLKNVVKGTATSDRPKRFHI